MVQCLTSALSLCDWRMYNRSNVLLPARTSSGRSGSQALVIAIKLCWRTPPVGTRIWQTWQHQIAIALYEHSEPARYQVALVERARLTQSHDEHNSSKSACDSLVTLQPSGGQQFSLQALRVFCAGFLYFLSYKLGTCRAIQC